MTIDALNAAAGRVAQSLTGTATPATVTGAIPQTATSKATSTTGVTVTSNDFLKLLVTEMKNQDPTQPTDPNAYIQQLVGVNSLQQLIAINKTLSGSTGTSAAIATTPPLDSI